MNMTLHFDTIANKETALFILAFVLSVLLRFTDSDYPLWYLQSLLAVLVFQLTVN